MTKVKMGFKDLQVPKQIERSRHIQTCMTDNLAFPSPKPTLAEVKLATDAVENAYNASRNRDKTEYALMRLCRKQMLKMITQLAAYVQSASEGDEMIIRSSGFDIITKGSALPAVTKVMNVRIKDGSVRGAIKLNWSPVVGARIYLVRVMLNPELPADADVKATPNASRCEVTGLTPGIRYYIEIAAVGGGAIGNWSNAVSLIVR